MRDNGSMLLTITMTGPEASGLGFLLHKHPDRVQTFSLPVGEATVFYPESSAERVTAALLLEIDPISMVRRRLKTREGLSLTDYVTDRPYAASSMLAVALGRVFTTALNGRCDSHPELAAASVPLELRVPAVPARGGESLVRALFEPLGWNVRTATAPFGPDGAWGDAPYVDLALTGTVRLADALSQLYVLLPVLDNAKHYWVSSEEVDKLVRRGEGWLAEHPEQELIVRRYLRARRSFIEDATARLNALDDVVDPEPDDEEGAIGLDIGARSSPPGSTSGQVAPGSTSGHSADDGGFVPLRVHRLEAVMAAVREAGARRVVDLGCGEGYYLRALIEEPSVTEVVGVDVSPRVLEYAERKLNLDRRPDRQREKLTLRQSSVTYRDDAIAGFDAVLLIEVIEHLEPDRIASLETSVFGAARPKHVILTTPNREYNGVYELADGQWRHPDHRFEWTRSELEAWATRVADAHGYRVAFRSVGEVDPALGAPTQLALFTDARTQEADHG